MAVSSMTGFARSDGHAKGLSWFWEIKSGNSRSLDVRCRLPQGFEGLEFDVKSIAQTKIHRGSLQVNLEINRDSGSQIRVNEMALAQVMALVKSLRKKHKLPAPTIEGLLSIRGVLETVEPDFDEKAVVARNRLLLGALDQSFEMLVKHRRAEGAHLKEIMLGHIARIRTLAEAARDCRGRSPVAIKARMKEQLDRLFETGRSLDADRLHQEALLLAAKSDVQEELDRIFAHVQAALELLNADSGPIGRKLDFLAQELNREANTLCAKAQDIELSSIGLTLKAVIDQMREQVQNIE
jgi:uncharacterized protein (TIGR00255 family)